MPCPPQPVLAVPPFLPPLKPSTLSVSLDELGLMAEEEEMSSDHLSFKACQGCGLVQ